MAVLAGNGEAKGGGGGVGVAVGLVVEEEARGEEALLLQKATLGSRH